MELIFYIALLIMITLLLRGQTIMTEAVDKLIAEVAETRTVADSAVALIQGLAQQIRDHVDDTAALNALADSLDGTQAELAEAIAANTPASPAEPAPAEPEAPVEPTPVEEPAPTEEPEA